MHMLISYSEPSESASVVSLINFAGYVGTTLLSVAMSGLASALLPQAFWRSSPFLGLVLILHAVRPEDAGEVETDPITSESSDSHFPLQTIAELMNDSYTVSSCVSPSRNGGS